MAAVIAVSPVFQFFDDNGDPLVGGLLYTYLTNTTTPATTWQDQDQITANTNPIVLDARGECRLWLDPTLTYTLALNDAADVLIWSADDITGPLSAGDLQNPNNPALGDALVAVRQPVVGAVATTQHEFNFRQLWLEDFGCRPDGQDATPGMIAALQAAASLGGAMLMASGGQYVFQAPFSFDGDNISIWGQGADATTFLIQHAGAYGIGMKKVATPGLSQNLGLFRLHVDYDTPIGPNPSTTRLIEAEFVDGLTIWGVTASRGGIGLALLGCSNVDVDAFAWDGDDGQLGTGRFGALVSRTSATYTGGVKHGSGIVLRGPKIRANSIAGTRGIAIECGDGVTVDGAWEIRDVGMAISLDRPAAMPSESSANITIADGRASGVLQFLSGVPTGISESIVALAIRNVTAQGRTGVNGPLSGLFVNGWGSIAGLQMSEVNFFDFDTSAEIGLTNDAAIRGCNFLANHRTGGATLYGLILTAGTNITISGNKIRGNPPQAWPGAGILLNGSGSSHAAIVGNVIHGFTTGISKSESGTDYVVDDNDLRSNITPLAVTGLLSSVTNRIQGMPIAFRAYRSGSAQTTASTAAVKLQLNAERFDPYGTYDSTTNYRWTPGVAATVLLSGSVGMSNPAAAGNFLIWVYKNGAALARVAQINVAASSATALSFALEDTCAATDYYEMWAAGDAAGTKSFNQNLDGEMTFFAGTVLQ